MNPHNGTSYISFNRGGGEAADNVSDINAAIISYPILISNHLDPSITKIFYNDLFVVDKTATRPQELINTHEYNKSFLLNDDLNTITLFKKEIELYSGIVPFINTTSSTYHIKSAELLRVCSAVSTKDISLLSISAASSSSNKGINNVNYLMDFMDNLFKLSMIPLFCSVGVDTILCWIKEKIFFVYALIQPSTGKLIAIYFFKDTNIIYEVGDDIGATPAPAAAAGHKNIQFLIGFSMIEKQDVAKNDAFYIGFIMALNDIVNKVNLDFKILTIENIGHNNTILEHWNKKNNPFIETAVGYYFWNYCIPRIMHKEDIFILV
jgi:hypothetical protein